MTQEDFHKKYPNLKHKVLVRKDRNNVTAQLIVLYCQLAEYFDDYKIAQEHCKRQINADNEYHVFWFEDEKVSCWFSLKWS